MFLLQIDLLLLSNRPRVDLFVRVRCARVDMQKPPRPARQEGARPMRGGPVRRGFRITVIATVDGITVTIEPW